MKKLLVTILIWFGSVVYLTAQKIQILPIPQKVESTQKKLRIDRKFEISLNSGFNQNCQHALDRLIANWEKKTLKKISPSINATSDFDFLIDPSWSGQSSTNEEYELQIDTKIHLRSKSESGFMHGLESLAQLIQSDSTGYFLPQCKISDWPRFVHRGLMIDVARHFIPLEVILRSIDGMAASKMNVLHLHLSDDEGFRIESKKFPNLQLKGSNGEFFTQEEIKKIVSYASERGIMVIPEFDLPGHSQSWFVGYPALASEKKEYKLGPRFIVEEGKPMNPMALSQMINSQATPTINPADEKTYKFLMTFFKEMMSLFPGPYFHVGMDENNGIAWKNNPSIQAFMKSHKIANEHDLQAYFGDRLNQMINKLGKKTVMWEEGFNAKIDQNVIIQLWKPALMGKVLQTSDLVSHQNSTIISRGFYLDYFMPSAFHYMNSEILDLKSDENVLGGEAAIWTELVDQNNFELRIWPRVIAVASRLWSASEEKDVERFYDKLPDFDAYLKSIGLQHQSRSESQLATLLNRNLTNDDRQLFQVIAPARGFKRLINTMTQPTSLKMAQFNQFADVLPSDSYLKWEFRRLVKEYLLDNGNPEKREKLLTQLAIWASLGNYVEANVAKSYHIQTIKPLVKQLGLCSQLVHNKLNLLNSKSDAEILAEIQKLKKMVVSDLECVISDELESIVSGKLKEVDLKLSLF